jgi:ribonuclease HII
VEKGDSTYYSIAAASILAKVARDDYILDLCEQHPYLVERYGLDKNKGYGAKKHMDGIREHGITEWHRKSYRPCNGTNEKPRVEIFE